MTPDAPSTPTASPWPYRWAWVLCCATFPLVWVGGLITTTDAGMAVPDWPGTYGYNLFLYPWETWLFGPWDLFIEHGHRLLASLVGLLTIAFVVIVWRCGSPAWLRWIAVAALLLVIGQGVLGGLRVVLNARHVALLHGSTGPAFFGLTAALVALTAPKGPTAGHPRASRWVWLLPTVVFCQLVLGATLRHVPEDGHFNTFAQHVVAHLVGATVVLVAVTVTAFRAWTRPAAVTRRVLASLLACVVIAQISLGVATWVAKYRLPNWAQQGVAADAWAAVAGPGTIGPSTAGGWTETHVVTAHSAIGSLLLALSVAHAVVARRRPAQHATPADPLTASGREPLGVAFPSNPSPATAAGTP